MKVLVVGSGGREHALAWKLKQSADVDEVIVAPGNAGTQQEPGVRNVDIAATDTAGLITLCQRENIEFTVVGLRDQCSVSRALRACVEGDKSYNTRAGMMVSRPSLSASG